MINLRKNEHGNVVGISVRGKTFNLNRELCSLLDLEERELFKKINETKKDIELLTTSLSKTKITSESTMMETSITFTKENLINLESIKLIKNLSSLPDKQAELLIEIINDFLFNINESIKQRTELTATMTNKIAA